MEARISESTHPSVSPLSRVESINMVQYDDDDLQIINEQQTNVQKNTTLISAPTFEVLQL